MLIMEIYSSLRRKNVKSKDSRYHHQNITVDLKKAVASVFTRKYYISTHVTIFDFMLVDAVQFL